jgi:hypothetical protein
VTETIELSLRGLPEWLIREYFKEMGAQFVGDDETATGAAAEGWSVSWTHQRVRIAGSRGLGLTQFDLVFVGEALQQVHDDFMKKAQRGGG